MSKRIGIQSWGSEGDLRPFVALAAGLRRVGHEVTLVVTDISDRDYEKYEDALDITVRTVATPVLSDADAERLGRELVQKPNPFEQGKLINRAMFRPVVPQMFEAAKQLCAESDLVIGHFYLHPLDAAAELSDTPRLSVTLQADVLPSAAYAPTGVKTLGGFWNRFWWKFVEKLMANVLLPEANELRDAVGLPKRKTMAEVWHSDLLDVVAVSPTLCPPRDDWHPRHKMSGFIQLEGGGGAATVPDSVESFLNDGSPPVFMGFGSLTPRDTAGKLEAKELLETAARRSGKRAIIQGLTDEEETALAGRILHVGRVPHDLVYPRCAAVVHHGGSGTTQTAMTAGVPSVIVPHVFDQFTWGNVVHALGAGTKPLPRKKLKPGPLAELVNEAANSKEMHERAAELGRALAEEDGQAEAVRFVDEAIAAL